MGCSILSALHALDSFSFLSACDSSVGEEWRKEEDNQRWIVKRKTNPLRALLSETRTSVSCKKKAQRVAQSQTDFYFDLLSLAFDGQGLCSYYKTLNSQK